MTDWSVNKTQKHIPWLRTDRGVCDVTATEKEMRGSPANLSERV